MRIGSVFRRNIFQDNLLMRVTFVLSACLLAMSSFSVYAQLDDPTRPPGHRLVIPGQKKVTRAKRFSLSLIQISSTRRSAIVNDRIVEVGNTVNGAKVKLKKKGKVFTIKLLSQVVKRQRAY